MNPVVWRQLRAADPGLLERWHEIALDPSRPPSMGELGRLKDAWGDDMARFASLQAELRRRSARRFPEGLITFWTSKGLEQATPAAVASYRAARFAAEAETMASPWVWDACSGAGSDAVTLARCGLRLVASDASPDAARCTSANLRVALEGRETAAVTLVGDATVPPLSGSGKPLIMLDPDRRTGTGSTQRTIDPESWGPSLSKTLSIAKTGHGACVKLSPGLSVERVGRSIERRLGSTPFAYEWISLDGELKELTVWTGALAAALDERQATALAGAGSPESYSGSACADDPLPEPVGLDALVPGTTLIELDVSLWQSGLAGAFATEHRLAPIEVETQGMFLVATGPPPPNSPLIRGWPILASAPADRKRVRKLLREHDIGPVTVKKRQHPRTSIELEKTFAGTGAKPGRLAVFRVPSGSAAILLGTA